MVDIHEVAKCLIRSSLMFLYCPPSVTSCDKIRHLPAFNYRALYNWLFGKDVAPTSLAMDVVVSRGVILVWCQLGRGLAPSALI